MKIENYREQPSEGNVLAIFDIYFETWQMTFRNWKLIRSKKGTTFVSGPSFSTTELNGEKKFHPLIEFTTEKKRDFETKVMEALQPFLEQSKESAF